MWCFRLEHLKQFLVFDMREKKMQTRLADKDRISSIQRSRAIKDCSCTPTNGIGELLLFN